MVNTKSYNNKNKKEISYPNLPSALRPLPRADSLPVPVPRIVNLADEEIARQPSAKLCLTIKKMATNMPAQGSQGSPAHGQSVRVETGSQPFARQKGLGWRRKWSSDATHRKVSFGGSEPLVFILSFSVCWIGATGSNLRSEGLRCTTAKEHWKVSSCSTT